MSNRRAKREVIRGDIQQCSDEYGVVPVLSRGGSVHAARRQPCEQCPWRQDVPTHRFPAEAFRVSAPTAYDMSESTFGCHMSPADAPATCAGFLLRHGVNNLGVRMAQISGRLDVSRVKDNGVELYRSYREMAIANGVDPDDPVLVPVRGDDDP